MEETKKKLKVKPKVLIYISCFIILCSLVIIIYSVMPKKEETKTVLTYKAGISQTNKVYNNDDIFYKPEYLENKHIYLSSITNKIKFTLNYDIEYSSSNIINYSVDVTGKIIVEDLSSKEILWDKSLDFVKITEESPETAKLNISKDFTFDFGAARALLLKYQDTYGIAVNGYAIINAKITVNNLYDGFSDNIIFEDGQTNYRILTITIPLLGKTFTVTDDSLGIQEKNIKVIKENYNNFNQIVHIIGDITLIIGIICLTISIFIKKKRTTSHDIYNLKVKELVSKYEEIIVRVDEMPSNNDLNLIKVLEFNDLIDVEQEIKSPILLITNKDETIFTIIKKDYQYYYVISEKDFK